MSCLHTILVSLSFLLCAALSCKACMQQLQCSCHCLEIRRLACRQHLPIFALAFTHSPTALLLLPHPAAPCRTTCCLTLLCRERQQQLQELSADTERLDAWAVEFMPNGAKLSQVLADGGGNLTVFMYDMKVRGLKTEVAGLCAA